MKVTSEGSFIQIHGVTIALVALFLVTLGQCRQIRVIESRLNEPTEQTGATGDQAIALKRMSELAEEKKFGHAEDLLRYSVRVSPGSYEVFQALMAEAKVSVKAMEGSIDDEELFLDFNFWVQEILGSTERMIPFLDYDKIEVARDTWLGIFYQLETLDEATASGEDLEKREYEMEIKPLVVDVLDELAQWADRFASNEINELNGELSELNLLLSSILPLYEVVSEFSSDGIELAKIDYENLSDSLIKLNRLRTWSYNHHSLKVIQFASEIGRRDDRFGKAQLFRLARLDESRFIPYVSHEYQRVWNLHFEGLASQEDKERVIKAQILKSLGE